MKFDFWTLICIALVIFNCFSTVRLVSKVLKGNRLLKKARAGGEAIVKGNNNLYDLKHYLFAIVTELICIFFIFKLLSLYRITIAAFAVVALTIAAVAVTVVIHVIAIFKEKNVYLTEHGLIYFLGSFEFSDSRFLWESSEKPEILSKTLYIYKKKDKFPFTVSFDSDIETAHKIVSENSRKSDMS